MGVICFFAVLVGTVSGTYWATVSPVLAEILGLRDLPSGLSINWLTLVAPTTVSEAIALVMRDNNSEDSAYLRVQIFTGFMYIGASLCLWVVRGWKVGEVVRAEEEELSSARATESRLTEKPCSETCHSVGVENEESESQQAAHSLPASHPPTIYAWSPLYVLRNMVTLKKV